MAKGSERSEAWTGPATDYVLAHGLIGLSLRPLAKALGTSDRMLLYHFGTKDDLVAAILTESNDRAVAAVAALPPSPDVRTAVLDLWSVASSAEYAPCTRLYVEAAALGLLGREPYAGMVREANGRWYAALVAHLTKSGVARPTAQRVVTVIDAAFVGFQLDSVLDTSGTARTRAVSDLAEAAVQMTS